MTIARFSHQVQSSGLGYEEVNDLLKLTANRASNSPTGGFQDQWHDTHASNTDNLSPTPFKIHEYSVRVWTDGPCIVWSSDVEQYVMAAAGGVDTSFTQFNIANETIKKWTLTDGGRTWAHLGKKFVSKKRMRSKSGKTYYKSVGRPRYYNNKQFKLQIENIDPSTSPSDVAYYAIIEGIIEYDAQ